MTGPECSVIEVATRSTRRLEAVSSSIGMLGPVVPTSVASHSPLPRRTPGR
jgi:hypothetical protein